MVAAAPDTTYDIGRIADALGSDADSLLNHTSTTISKEDLHLPGPDFIDRVWINSDRTPQVLRSLQAIYGNGRLAGTGYVSILPVDQGIEHSAGASFAPNPIYFDPENIVKLAIEGGCNAVASTFGVLGIVARKYAHKIPMIVKINHNELLTYPNKYDQVIFGTVKQIHDMGAVAVGATIYFGSEESTRQLVGFKALNTGGSSYGKLDERIYTQLTSDHPIDLTRYQVANCFMGRAGLISSGGASGANDFAEAVETAVINKRAGGTGLISGRKAFQRPIQEGASLLNAIQDVYLCEDVTIA
jgi:fructose-bisphosphate aldolase, class I